MSSPSTPRPKKARITNPSINQHSFACIIKHSIEILNHLPDRDWYEIKELVLNCQDCKEVLNPDVCTSRFALWKTASHKGLKEWIFSRFAYQYEKNPQTPLSCNAIYESIRQLWYVDTETKVLKIYPTLYYQVFAWRMRRVVNYESVIKETLETYGVHEYAYFVNGLISEAKCVEFVNKYYACLQRWYFYAPTTSLKPPSSLHVEIPPRTLPVPSSSSSSSTFPLDIPPSPMIDASSFPFPLQFPDFSTDPYPFSPTPLPTIQVPTLPIHVTIQEVKHLQFESEICTHVAPYSHSKKCYLKLDSLSNTEGTFEYLYTQLGSTLFGIAQKKLSFSCHVTCRGTYTASDQPAPHLLYVNSQGVHVKETVSMEEINFKNTEKSITLTEPIGMYIRESRGKAFRAALSSSNVSQPNEEL
jgi:hypothetical protein